MTVSAYQIMAIVQLPYLPEGVQYLYARAEFPVSDSARPKDVFTVLAHYCENITCQLLRQGASVEDLHWQIMKPLNQKEALARILSH